MIPEDKVREIRERTDLVALVSDYVALKRSGVSLKGLCPFHSEKSPSFYVHPDRGFFHCFGCQASGDAISFLMRIDGHPFPEAARILAERVGVEIATLDSETERAARQARAKKERLLSVVEAAAGFFVKMLSEHKFGAMARQELARRGIEEETVQAYRLGYAPHGWDELSTYLGERGFSPTDCEQVGLAVPRRSGTGHYDRFRHRLMFPVADAHGRIVAFSGRILDAPPGLDGEERVGRERPAKYVNSPETLLYKKGEILFGLHEARVELRRRDLALVCEGNFDVLALSQAGFPNVVAPLGTALTMQQAKLLRRFAATAVLLFDADAAGRKAVRASQPLLNDAGLAAKVVTLPPGEDPDSFLRTKGNEALTRLVSSAPGIVEWLIDSAATEAGADARAKADAIEGLGPVLGGIDNPVERQLYVERVAKAFEVRDAEAVRRQLRRGLRSGSPRRVKEVTRGKIPQPQRPATVDFRTAELEAVGAFLDFPSLHRKSCAKIVQDLLTSADLRAIFCVTVQWTAAGGVDASALLEKVQRDNPARPWLESRLAIQAHTDEAEALRTVERAMVLLERDRFKQMDRRLKREILEARRAGDDERAEALTRRMMELFRGAREGAIRGTEGTKG